MSNQKPFRPYPDAEDLAALDGPEKWVPEAIAEQEAYLAKMRAARRFTTAIKRAQALGAFEDES